MARTKKKEKKKKVVARNAGLFTVELMAKTKKQGENPFGSLLLHIYHWKKKKGGGPDDNKRSRVG